MTTLAEPRNAAAVRNAAKAGKVGADPIVVSFVGDTELDGVHVYADGGKRYDWRFLRGLPVAVVVKPGVDCLASLRSIYDEAQLYPTIVDFERQVVGSIVDRNGRVWPIGKGTEPWLALFG